MKKNIKILAIETSCDETAASVIGVKNNQPIILSNIVSSQVDLHAKTGGVVPEVASRAHMESILPVIAEALTQARNNQDTRNKIQTNFKFQNIKLDELYKLANFELKSIDFVAVTAGPGLVGSLLVGFNAAKSLAYALDKPIIAVNHIEGHIYSALSGIDMGQGSRAKGQDSALGPRPSFPILALTVSGGHTSLTLMKDHGKYENLGQTLDDAAGEAFDKVAKLLDLGYPGGPAVSKLANEHRNNLKFKIYNLKSISNDKIINDTLIENCPEGHLKGEKLKIENSPKGVVFPRPILNDGTFNFSFSGLKTAVLQHVLNIKKERDLTDQDKEEICAAFEDAVVDVLTTKTMRAVDKFKPKAIILAGGVAANDYLRKTLELSTLNLQLATKFLMPPKIYCGDNAAMIGLAAFYNIKKNNISSWDKVKIDSNLEL